MLLTRQLSEIKKQYQKYKSILGDNSLESLEEFLTIKYNNDEWNMFKSYASSIKSGELTPLADFDLYKDISKQIDNSIVGLTTANGIRITGKSNHFIARVIGSVEQDRNGVSIGNIISAVKSPDEIKPERINKNGKSQRFVNNNCIVSINTHTGNLIQVNPYKKKVQKC